MAPEFFLNPTHPMQRRYEALRASFVEGLNAHEVAKKFGYSIHTVNALRRDFKAGLLQPFFLPLTRGPKNPRPATGECKERIIALRKQSV
jgi:transposase